MKIKIPRGWRKLRKGTLIKEGDKFWCVNDWALSFCVGESINDSALGLTYIRRITKKAKSK